MVEEYKHYVLFVGGRNEYNLRKAIEIADKFYKIPRVHASLKIIPDDETTFNLVDFVTKETIKIGLFEVTRFSDHFPES